MLERNFVVRIPKRRVSRAERPQSKTPSPQSPRADANPLDAYAQSQAFAPFGCGLRTQSPCPYRSSLSAVRSSSVKAVNRLLVTCTAALLLAACGGSDGTN